MSEDTSDTTPAAAAPEVTAPAINAESFDQAASQLAAEFANEQATTQMPAADLAELAASTETDPASADDAPIIEDAYHLGPSIGESVFFSFVDHESHKIRPATVVQGYANGHADLFVLFHPSDRIAGTNATPGVVMSVPPRMDSEVAADALHRCWF